MKMPEKRDLCTHSRGKDKASGQSLRLQWRTFAECNGGAFKNINRANDVRHYRLDS